ncbi:MAG: dicarboxylate/amino acid:cation symporter, partial [Verrucomicrobiota bacterium]
MAETDRKLSNRIMTGLVIGALAGVVTLLIGHGQPAFLAFMKDVSTSTLDPFGQVFLRLLFFVVIPLVFTSLAAGVAQLGRLDRLGPLAGRTFLLFFLNMAIAVALGLVMMNVLRPGDHLDASAKSMLMDEFGGAARRHVATAAAAPAVTFSGLVEMFMPKNLFGAVMGHSNAVLGEVLPLIVFALLVGVVGAGLPEERRLRLLAALDLVSELMTGIVRLALRLAPFAVPVMIYSVVVKVGLDILVALGVFALGCLGVMLLHLFGTMSLWLKFWTDRRPPEFFRDVRSVLVTAFSTSSSNATLPAALD